MIDRPSIRRLVENEAVFRQNNEKVPEDLEKLSVLATSEGSSTPDTSQLVLQFCCECSDENCTLRIPLKIREYATIHQNRRCFVVAPGHELPSIEKVVKKMPGYLVVEKFAEAPERPQNLHKTDINNT